MRRFLGFIVVVLIALPGCSSLKGQRVFPESSAFSGIQTIRLDDKTDPVLLRGSGAKMVGELFQASLEGKGYTVCRSECTPDAVATLNVQKYYRALKSGLPMRYGTTVREVSGLAFQFTIRDRADKIIFNFPVKYTTSLPQSDLTVKMVQEVSERIPAVANSR